MMIATRLSLVDDRSSGPRKTTKRARIFLPGKVDARCTNQLLVYCNKAYSALIVTTGSIRAALRAGT
jgi:hypothetical protein